jgi:hypothetical protein
MRKLREYIGTEQFSGNEMTQNKVLDAFAANEMKKQDNSNTESIDPAILPGAPAA